MREKLVQAKNRIAIANKQIDRDLTFLGITDVAISLKDVLTVCLLSVAIFLSGCFVAQNSYDGGYQCSWWHLHKHPNYQNYCDEQKAKWEKRHWED